MYTWSCLIHISEFVTYSYMAFIIVRVRDVFIHGIHNVCKHGVASFIRQPSCLIHTTELTYLCVKVCYSFIQCSWLICTSEIVIHSYIWGVWFKCQTSWCIHTVELTNLINTKELTNSYVRVRDLFTHRVDGSSTLQKWSSSLNKRTYVDDWK